MRLKDVRTSRELRDFMTTPTEALVEFLSGLEGDVLVLGAAGKMGPELVETVVRADRLAGTVRRVHAASRFSAPSGGVLDRFGELAVEVHQGDMTERSFLAGLPSAPNVVFMAGFKFGSSGDWRRAFHLNCIMPYLVGERFPEARIVVFSSGNPYPPSPPGEGGSTEQAELRPQGVYGWSIVARESAFATTAARAAGQRLAFFRLMYAQHLAYGVLVDLATMVRDGEPISLATPAVNLVSQRDAIDVALRALGHCRREPFVLNCAGPIIGVRDIAERLGRHMGKPPVVLEDEGDVATLADDTLCTRLLGPYRDAPDEMIEGVAAWVAAGGESWAKPTLFGRVKRLY